MFGFKAFKFMYFPYQDQCRIFNNFFRFLSTLVCLGLQLLTLGKRLRKRNFLEIQRSIVILPQHFTSNILSKFLLLTFFVRSLLNLLGYDFPLIILLKHLILDIKTFLQARSQSYIKMQTFRNKCKPLLLQKFNSCYFSFKFMVICSSRVVVGIVMIL